MMTDLQVVVMIAVVAGVLGTPWWYSPLCAIVLVALQARACEEIVETAAMMAPASPF